MKATDTGKDGKASQVAVILDWLVVRVNDGVLDVFDKIICTLLAVLPVLNLLFELLDASLKSACLFDEITIEIFDVFF